MSNEINFISSIMSALETQINAIVDKRVAQILEQTAVPAVTMAELDALRHELMEMMDTKLDEHTSEYDHEEYDATVRVVEDAGLDNMDSLEDKIKDVLRNVSVSFEL